MSECKHKYNQTSPHGRAYCGKCGQIKPEDSYAGEIIEGIVKWG